MAAVPDFDPFSAEFRTNAIAMFRLLQEQDPVHQNADGTWLWCRYKDVHWALTDHDRFERPTDWSRDRKPEGPFRDFGRSNMVAMNPPEHTRFRKSVSRAFSARQIKSMEGKIGLLVDGLLDDLRDRSQMDVITDFAFHLPVIVICEMLGIPPEDRTFFKKNTTAMLQGLEVMADDETMARAAQASADLHDYLSAVAREREREPQNDLISLLIQYEQEDNMTRDEVLYSAITLLIAGHETTTHLLGNGMLALIRNPDQLQLLTQDLTLVRNAVEEFLRYDPSLYYLWRRAKEDLTLDGKTIQAGVRVAISLVAANRDPAVFENPDRLDIQRPNASKNLTFGGGIHLCLGHALARLEAKLAFEKLLTRFGAFELAGEPIPRDGMMFRGYDSIPVSFARRAA